MTQKKVLIVEDEEAIRTALAVDLRSQGGFECLEAPDHREAIELLEKEKVVPHLVLVDIMMPSSPEAGIELIKEVKGNPSWNQVPIVVLSAKSQSKIILSALRYGAIDYIVKPYDPIELIERAQRAISLGTSLDAKEDADQEVDDEEQRWRMLHVEVIRLSLLYWEITTQKTKVDLAELTNLWSFYLDTSGCYRTKTLDRYMNYQTLPKNPNTLHVIKTAYFVLQHCTPDETFRPQLQKYLEELEHLNRTHRK